MADKRESFGSRRGVIMAMAGSAIGLSNIWRFPYMTGEYGGAVFILTYIFCSFLLSLPIFLCECVIGRRTRSNAIGAMNTLAAGTPWRALGYLSVITPVIIVSYYSIVGGWSVEYFLKSFTLSFGQFTPTGWTVLIFNTLFLGISCAVVALGVKSGIEKFSRISIPLLFVLIILVTVYSVNMSDSQKGIEYLVRPDFSKLTPRTFAFALGQSFYSLSLGMGIIITYSSYISKKENLLTTAAGTAIADLLFAILAGFAIMPAVFSAGIRPNSGPGLIFQTLPFVFSRMGADSPILSAAAAVLFFLGVIIAAMTSAISLLEVAVAYLVEEKKIERKKASLIVFAVTWLLGLGSVFSSKFFSAVDTFSSNFLLTIGALLAVLFVGWKMKKDDVKDELTNGGTKDAKAFPLIWFLIRYIAPLAIGIIFISNLIP